MVVTYRFLSSARKKLVEIKKKTTKKGPKSNWQKSIVKEALKIKKQLKNEKKRWNGGRSKKRYGPFRKYWKEAVSK